MAPIKNLLAGLSFFICTVSANCQVITSVAGNATLHGYYGDGGPATAAWLSYPASVLADPEGNYYIADEVNFRVRKVNAIGFISTIAGDGTGVHGGDGGPATAAGLSFPCGLSFDKKGNLYIAESGTNTGTDISYVRKVDPSGIITRYAGGVNGGHWGDGGPATNAGFRLIRAVATDNAGDVYIADADDHRIRKVDTNGIITTVAGTGVPGFSGDGGPATAAEISNVYSLAVDVNGSIFIADSYNNRVRKITTSGLIITVAGNGTAGFAGDDGFATDAALNNPYGVAVDNSGNIYVADVGNNRIRKVNTGGIITTVAGNGLSGYSGDGGPALDAELYWAGGVSADISGNVYVTDIISSNIRKIWIEYEGVGDSKVTDDKMQLWPQPNDGNFTIKISSATDEPAQIVFTNIIGQKIKAFAATANKEERVQLDAPPGVYFCNVITKNGNCSGRLTIVK